MTLQEIFYLLGIVYILGWLAFLIAIVVFSFIAYRRWKEIRAELKRSSLASLGVSLLKPSSLAGVIAAWPLVQLGLSKFFGKKKK